MKTISLIRQDIKPIIDIKKVIEDNNRWNKNDGMFYKSSKEDAINEGYKVLKRYIIDLAKKYKGVK